MSPVGSGYVKILQCNVVCCRCCACTLQRAERRGCPQRRSTGAGPPVGTGGACLGPGAVKGQALLSAAVPHPAPPNCREGPPPQRGAADAGRGALVLDCRHLVRWDWAGLCCAVLGCQLSCHDAPWRHSPPPSLPPSLLPSLPSSKEPVLTEQGCPARYHAEPAGASRRPPTCSRAPSRPTATTWPAASCWCVRQWRGWRWQQTRASRRQCATCVESTRPWHTRWAMAGLLLRQRWGLNVA